jgi:glycosyltransferase involved in cell wall biosynthesis
MKQVRDKVLITLPVYNEEKQLYKKTLEVLCYAKKNLGELDYTILIADNGSTDKTSDIGKELSRTYEQIKYFYMEVKGRGKVLYHVWKECDADCYVYMDIDLATDLKHLKDLIVGVLKKNFDIAIGTRNAARSKVQRSLKRTIISKTYINLLKLIFGLKVTDTQCGFKALSLKARKILWPRLDPANWVGSAWFFDAELLILAEKLGLKIYEVPVEWSAGLYSSVSLLKDVKEDLSGIVRMIKTKPWEK